VYLCFPDCWRGSLDHGLSLNNNAPNMIWMCSFIDYLSLNTIVFSTLIHHLIIFHCPLADLNTTCFPFKIHCIAPKVSQFFKEYWEELMSFHVKYFADSLDVLHCSTIFLVLESNLILQRSCIFKSNCWDEIKEISILKNIF